MLSLDLVVNIGCNEGLERVGWTLALVTGTSLVT